MISRLYKNRFELFLVTQTMILFGSLFFPLDFFEFILLPILYLLNIATGILLISKEKKVMWFCIVLFIVSSIIFGSDIISNTQTEEYILVRMSIYFVFHIIVALNIIKQVWNADFVNKNVVMGLMSGYISLGFLAFFLFTSIELVNPGSFSGELLQTNDINVHLDSLLYYAYITLLTIGYGEIVPVSPIAQKAAILVGLMGQFYIVIITAVIVEKYIAHTKK